MSKSFKSIIMNESEVDFATYMVEIIEKFLDYKKISIEQFEDMIKTADNVKAIQNTLISIISKLGLDEDNPNYKAVKQFEPKNFDKVSVSNGDANTYDSQWFKLNDAKRFTLTRKALTKFAKQNNIEFDAKIGL